ncbi:MAG: alpha/beta hydrolase [Patescibacteria group bacterium]|nr:alpha/beta hydrolase [Patescibacteria group bacterium]
MKKIFILHGWTYSTAAWDAVCSLLRQRGYDPMQLKIPGLTADTSEVWTVESYTTWLTSQVNNDVPIILVGHSNGGRIAIAFAAACPEAVSRLILIDAAGILHTSFFLQMKRLVFKGIARMGKRLTSSVFLRKVFYRLIGARDYERASPIMRLTMKNLIERDLTPELSRITSPTLIIWGSKDKATPLSDAHVMNTNIRKSKLAVIPDAAHSPHATHPEVVVTMIDEWLRTE